MKQQLTQGPALHVLVHLNDAGIESVELTPSSTPHLSFECRGGLPQAHKRVADWLKAYAAKKPLASVPPLADRPLAAFTKNVLDALMKIPFGKTLSYKSIGQLLHTPRGARAVGTACGKNPFPLFIPCHRVIASSGALGGFSCGLEIKKRLLDFEESMKLPKTTT